MIERAGLRFGTPNDSGALLRFHPHPDLFDASHRLMPSQPYVWLAGSEFEQCEAALPKQMRGMRFADIGAGTGIYAMLAAQRGAQVVAFESDERTRALLAENAALNHLTIEVRGRFPDEWDGTPFDLAFAIIGNEIPQRDVAKRIIAWHPELGMCEVYGAAADARPLLAARATVPALPAVKPTAPVPRGYGAADRWMIAPPHPDLTVAEALGLLRAGWQLDGPLPVVPWRTSEELAQDRRTLQSAFDVISRGALSALAESPDDREAIVECVLRGDQHIAHFQAMRPLHAKHGIGAHWGRLHVTRHHRPCGCIDQVLESEDDDLEYGGRRASYHQHDRACAMHGANLDGWKQMHRQNEAAGIAERLRPGLLVALEPRGVILRPQATDAAARSAAVDQLRRGLAFILGEQPHYRVA